jgi:hypothetical protein
MCDASGCNRILRQPDAMVLPHSCLPEPMFEVCLNGKCVRHVVLILVVHRMRSFAYAAAVGSAKPSNEVEFQAALIKYLKCVAGVVD